MPGLGELAGLAGAFCWGVTSLLVRRAAARVDLVRLNAAMLAVAAVVVGGLTLALDELGLHHATLGSQPWLVLGYLAASVVLNFVIGNSCYFQSLHRLGVARAMPLTLTQSLLAAILAVGLLGERLTPGLALGVLLIPSGVYLVAGTGSRGATAPGPGDRVGVALGLAAALAWALGAVVLRHAVVRSDPLTATVARVALGALVLAAMGWLGGRRPRSAGGQSGWPSLRLALLIGAPFSGSSLLFTVAVSLVGAARATTLSATAPLFVLPIAAFWLGEPVTRWTVAGTLLTVLGVALVVSF